MHWEDADGRLSGTSLLTENGAFAARMVAGIGVFLDRETAAAGRDRASNQLFSPASPTEHETCAAARRKHLARIVGVVDQRLPIESLQLFASTAASSLVAETPAYGVHAVRWAVLEGVDDEGLLLEPSGPVVADVVAIPDADCTRRCWSDWRQGCGRRRSLLANWPLWAVMSSCPC